MILFRPQRLYNMVIKFQRHAEVGLGQFNIQQLSIPILFFGMLDIRDGDGTNM